MVSSRVFFIGHMFRCKLELGYVGPYMRLGIARPLVCVPMEPDIKKVLRLVVLLVDS